MNFRDFFNPFEYWTVNLDKNEVCSRNSKYSLSDFIYKVHQGYRLIEPSEIIKFDELIRENCLNYQY